ncbi:MAG TPA: hypothetical protein PL101_08670 [Bacteroidales bacterium]|nr:hypothetical protein [Bacteroidales bacterium]HQK71168.1 hypothetical protein [Bacteroidales bacterium]
MKKLIVLTVSLFIILPKLAGQEITLKPYGIKSGIIEYSYSGDKVGKGTLYFDDYGMKSAMYTDAVADGEKGKGWIVTFGDYQYIWDLDHPDEGLKLENPIITWLAESSKGDFESFTESMFSKMGFNKAPDETFLGKPCKVVKGDMGKVLTWNGILMLLDMNVMGTVSHQEATKIQTNIPVDAKYFAIPKNIKFSEMPMMF